MVELDEADWGLEKTLLWWDPSGEISALGSRLEES